MEPKQKRVIQLYLLMMIFHIAHLFEEIWGNFIMIDFFRGIGWFLAINWLIFILLMVLLYFILLRKLIAYYMGIFYASVMILNGLLHNIAFIVTGNYYGGYAGNFTGIGLVIIGPALIYYLKTSINVLKNT